MTDLADAYPRSAAVTSIAPEGGDESAVSWGAIFAGAAGAAVLSIVLVLLGTGLGLTMVSPWSHEGISASAATLSTVGWVTVVQILASILGGYLAGRLRSRWTQINLHEVYFRDTAHGFLAWAVATLLTATLLSSAVGSLVAGSVKAGTGAAVMVSSAAGAGAAAGNQTDSAEPLGYYVDSLFRAAPAATPGTSVPSATAANPSHATEVGRIFTNGLKSGELAATDTQYLAQLVASSTGLAPADAERRVTDAFSKLKQTLDQIELKAKEAADAARTASAYLSLWLVITLFIGAFTASWAATFGGRLRDSSVLAHH